jgi:hypothetical protein
MVFAAQTKSPENIPVSFPTWKQALAGAALSPAQKAAHQLAIIDFLRHCKGRHAPATISLVRQYLPTLPPSALDGTREVLRWFFRGAKTHPTAGGAVAGM